MGLTLIHILFLLCTALFFLVMFFSTADLNKEFLKYMILIFPFLGVSITINVLTIAVFDLLTVLFFLFFYTSKNRILFTNGLYFFIFVVLTTVIGLGMLLAESLTNETLHVLVQYVSIAIFAKILIDELFEDPLFFFIVVHYFKIALITSLFFLIGQFVFGAGFTFERGINLNVFGTVVGMAQDRLPSFFQDPQKYAQFLAATSFLFLVKDAVASKPNWINYLMLLLAIVALFVTGGRAAFGGWMIGILVIALLGKPQTRYVLIFSFIVLGSIAYNYSENFALLNRDSSVGDAYDFRYAIWEDAFKIFKDNPIVGIGVGNYANYVSVHNPDQFWMSENDMIFYDHPESGYLKLLTEFGAVGFIATFAFFLIPIYKGAMLFIKNKDMNILLLIAALGSWSIGFYTVYSISDIRIRLLIVSIICLLIDRNKWGVANAK